MLVRHVWALVFRILLLATALYLFISDSGRLDFTIMPKYAVDRLFFLTIWITLAVGMLYRLFPNKSIAMGARKHFGISNSAEYNLDDIREKLRRLNKRACFLALIWVMFNAAVFFVLFLLDRLTPAAAIVIVLIYAVCDLAFILFFCPFQMFFMRNRCCVECRIYNWDYIMICTPLVFFPHIYSLSLIILALAVLLRWEAAVYKKAHLFIAETNKNLSCARCKDQLCRLRRIST